MLPLPLAVQVPPPAPTQVQVAVRLAGNVSATVAPGALEGPALLAVIVYVTEPPGVAVVTPSVFVMARSATGKRPTRMGSWSEARYGVAGSNTTRGGTRADPSGFSSNVDSPG